MPFNEMQHIFVFVILLVELNQTIISCFEFPVLLAPSGSSACIVSPYQLSTFRSSTAESCRMPLRIFVAATIKALKKFKGMSNA